MERWQNLSGRPITSLDLVKSCKQLVCRILPGHPACPSQSCFAHSGVQNRAGEDALNRVKPTHTVSRVNRKNSFAQQFRQGALGRGHHGRAAGCGLYPRQSETFTEGGQQERLSAMQKYDQVFIFHMSCKKNVPFKALGAHLLQQFGVTRIERIMLMIAHENQMQIGMLLLTNKFPEYIEEHDQILVRAESANKDQASGL